MYYKHDRKFRFLITCIWWNCVLQHLHIVVSYPQRPVLTCPVKIEYIVSDAPTTWLNKGHFCYYPWLTVVDRFDCIINSRVSDHYSHAIYVFKIMECACFNNSWVPYLYMYCDEHEIIITIKLGYIWQCHIQTHID